MLTIFAIPAIVEAIFMRGHTSYHDLIIFMIGVTLLGSFWDIMSTRHGRRDPIWLWQFNFSDMLGIKILGLPIEEYLFYIISSSCIIMTWESIRYVSVTHDMTMRTVLFLMCFWSLGCLCLQYYWGLKKGDRYK